MLSILDKKNETDAKRISYIRSLYRNFEQSSAIQVTPENKDDSNADNNDTEDTTNPDWVGDDPPPPPDDGIPY